MKRIILMVCAALVALVSCEKQPVETPISEGSKIVFNLSATHPGDTKAVKTAWENGDVIFVFFSGAHAPKYLKMTYNSTTNSWSNVEMNCDSEEALGLAENATGTMRAIYLPFDSDAIVNDDGAGNFIFNKVSYTYYLTATLSYTVTGGEVSGSFNMQIPEGYVQFFLDDETATDPNAEIELREPNLTPQCIQSIPANCSTVNVSTQALGAPIEGYLYDKESKATGEKKGWLFSGILAAGARNTEIDYHFTLVQGGWKGNYYSKSFAGKTLYTSDNTGRAVKLPALTSWTPITDYKPIDLGCDVTESGVTKRVYWSSRNLGACKDRPEGESPDLAERQKTWGDYYAWGATAPHYTEGAYSNPPTWAEGKTGYNWASCPYRYSEDVSKFTKYTTDGVYVYYEGVPDGKTVLEAMDDAASVNLQGLWRMPTDGEWTALRNEIENFVWAWDGTNGGCTITIKGGTVWEAPTIFLPAAGRRYNNVLQLTFGEAQYGRYWSSSLSYNDTAARIILFTSEREFDNNKKYHDSGDDYRSSGCSVRPVSY